MPHYNFECHKCGLEFSDLVRMSDPTTTCPGCSTLVEKSFTPTRNLHMAPWAASVNDDMNARNNAYIKSDAFQNKLKSGEVQPYDHQTEYSSPEYSSSFEERAKYDGITFDGTG